MNRYDDHERHYNPRPPRPLPSAQQPHSEFATHGDPSRPRTRAQAPTPVSDVEDNGTPPRRQMPWVRPSELPMVVLAPVLGNVVDQALTAQSKVTRAAVRAPAVVARVASRQVRARRAARRAKGLAR